MRSAIICTATFGTSYQGTTLTPRTLQVEDAVTGLPRAACHDLQIDAGCSHVETSVIADEEAEFLNNFTIDDRDEAICTHNEILMAIHTMGGGTARYKRERRSKTRAIVSEIYSAPRVTAMARKRRKYGIEPHQEGHRLHEQHR